MNKSERVYEEVYEDEDKVVCKIFNANTPAKFTAQEAKNLVKYLLVITRKAKHKVAALNTQLSYVRGSKSKGDKIKAEINQCIQKWSDHCLRLGVIPNTLWKVKIMSFNKNYYWEFPSANIR